MLGIDVIEIKRIETALTHGKFKQRVYTKAELDYYEAHGRRAETLAGMFAAKEAVAKALGSGLRFPLTDVEVLHRKGGAPYAVLHGEAARLSGEREAELSISHTAALAAAAARIGKEAAGPANRKPARVLTVEQIRRAERAAAEYGLNEDMLIENAAGALLKQTLAVLRGGGRVLVLAGGGNNGADGLSLARLLLTQGVETAVVRVAAEMNDCAGRRLKAFSALGGRTLSLDEAEKTAGFYDVIVDAVLGVGLKRGLEGDYLRAVRLINGSGAFKIAVDVPTGLNVDDGSVTGEAARADLTVTFGAYKYGHFLGAGADYCGRTVLCDIGLSADEGAFLCSDSVPAAPQRKKVSHKGDYGRVRIIGGSPEMVGAPLIAAESALKNGAGLVTLCVAASLKEAYQQRAREMTLKFLPGENGFLTAAEAAEAAEGADCVAIGMGMGCCPALADVICSLAHTYRGTLIVDADGLNALAGKPERLKGHMCNLILTPHRKEFARLFGPCKESEISKKTQAAARELNAVIVNKSNATLITDGSVTYINAAGTPAQAKGGSGDALAGAIAAWAVRLGPLEGAARACYLLGRAAERAAKRLGEDAPFATDVIEEAGREQ